MRNAVGDPEEAIPDWWSGLCRVVTAATHASDEGGPPSGLVPLLMVVLEELGRTLAPVPFLPSAMASILIARGGSAELRHSLLPRLADGSIIGTVAISGRPLDGQETCDHIVVRGTVEPILSGSVAAVLVVPVRSVRRETWYVIDTHDLVVEPLSSLDGTHRLARATASDVDVSRGSELATIDAGQVRSAAALLMAAEAAGGAAWCLETATACLKAPPRPGDRIGESQAIKHRAANMLLAVERAAAVSWAGGRPLDTLEDVELAGSIAASVGIDAFVRCAEDCIEILGAAGSTREHDAHLYLRRAVSLAQLSGGSTTWHQHVGRLSLAGRCPRADPLPREATLVHRATVSTFLRSITPLNDGERLERIAGSGYMLPGLDPPWGRGAGPLEQLVIDEEFRAAGVGRPRLDTAGFVLPVLARHGTPQQQERWIGPTLRGDVIWCQMFSEPDAGSDLASLSTAARRQETGWSLTGRKVWTTRADEAAWALCLARTGPARLRHRGITCFVVDMGSPGIEVRPLYQLTGEPGFSEITLDAVLVPDDCVVGDVDEGWTVALATLGGERAVMAGGSSIGGDVDDVIALVTVVGRQDDPQVIAQLGAICADDRAIALVNLRALLAPSTNPRASAAGSVRKVLATEHYQRLQEFALFLLGAQGTVVNELSAPWVRGFLWSRCLTIAGGTSEIQRNVIAERVLGLPRAAALVTGQHAGERP